MQPSRSERGTFRNRRGKDRYRAPLISERLHRKTGMSYFEQIVASTCQYMRAQWPEELQQLKWQVEDAGPLSEDGALKFAVDRETMTITLYRVPIERLMHNHRADPVDERMHIEHLIFEAVEEMMGRG